MKKSDDKEKNVKKPRKLTKNNYFKKNMKKNVDKE